MKITAPTFFLTFIFFVISCENSTDIKEIFLLSENSEKHIVRMEIDKYNHFYFITIESDKDTVMPICSSYLPTKINLIRQIDLNLHFEIIDDNFIGVGEMLFDNFNRMLINTPSGMFRKNHFGYDTILKEPLITFSIDSKNNIWAGGYISGLLKIDNNKRITRYTDSTSFLTTNRINCIYIDKNDVIWVAMWNNNGLLRINGEDWKIFNSLNSNITDQNIWTITSDSQGYIWIGTGHGNSDVSLMRLNENDWELMSPIINNEIILGTIKHLFSDDKNLYAISIQYDKDAHYSNKILAFNGNNWRKISLFPDGQPIVDYSVDNTRNVIWILTTGNKLYRLPIE